MILLFLIMVINSTLNAQKFSSYWHFGSCFSQIDGDGFGGFKKFGPNTLLEIGYGKGINDFHIGIGYSLKGSREMSPPFFFNTTLHYVDIPLFISLKIPKIDTLIKHYNKIRFQVGINYGYLFNGQIYNNGLIEKVPNSNIKKSELSHILGISYQFSKKTFLEIQYNYSLLTISKKQLENCWITNIYYGLINGFNSKGCWWNKNLKINLVYKIF